MDILYGIIGGLGLFLFGMRHMSEGLQKTAGARLKRLLEVLTTNLLSGVLMGAVVTALLQSSSTTTVMTVGFVNARLMTLRQAAGVIIGANIGTTVTAQLIAFRLEDFALPALGIGAALLLFGKADRIRFIGQVVMGFGMLFLGLELMKDAVRPLRELAYFRELLVSFAAHPLLGVLAGTVMTVAVQSSSASIGLLQSMAREGLIPIDSALPVLFGDNIGTTITAVLSAIGVSTTAKRTAAVHVVFNVVGTILFLLALPLVQPLIIASSTDVVRQIANGHTFFNVANTLVQLPFVGFILWLVLRLVPGKEDEAEAHRLDRRFLETPSLAIDLVRGEIETMVKKAREITTLSLEEFLSPAGGEKAQAALENEKEVNRINHEITAYLSQLAQTTLSEEQARTVRGLFNVVADVERVGDFGENIAELVQYGLDEHLTFTDTAVNELKSLGDLALEAFDRSVGVWRNPDHAAAQRVFDLEDEVDHLEDALRSNHIDRLNQGRCHPSSGIVFLDIASNLERIADHAANIASEALGK